MIVQFIAKITKYRGLLAWIRYLCPLVLPFIIILLLPRHEGFARLIGICIMIIAVISIFLWSSLNRRQNIIKGGKLSEPGNEKKRAIAEIFFRVLLFVCFLLFMWTVVAPTAIDIVSLSGGEEYLVVEGKIDKVNTLWGTWFWYQSITLETENNGNENYYLLYSTEPRLKEGTVCQFTVIPKSKMVLEVDCIK